MISNGLPGYPYCMTSYASADIADVDPVYGLQLHHPWFLEFIGAPESAHLLTRTPSHWVRTMDREDAVVATLLHQHDAGLITSNLQVLGQFVTYFNYKIIYLRLYYFLIIWLLFFFGKIVFIWHRDECAAFISVFYYLFNNVIFSLLRSYIFRHAFQQDHT